MKIRDAFTRTEKTNKKVENFALSNINSTKTTTWIFLNVVEQADTSDKIWSALWYGKSQTKS